MASTVAAPAARLVEELWPLTGVSVGPSYGGRFAREVFPIVSEEGRFVVKVNEDPPTPEVGAAELEVLRYLAARGYPHAPSLLRTRDDRLFVHTGDRSMFLLEFVPVASNMDTSTDAAAWAKLAGAAAALNRFEDYHHQFAQDFIDQVPEQLRVKVRGHVFEREYLRLLDRVQSLATSERRGLVHGEVNAANSGYRLGGTVVLLDWEGSGIGPTALDYGYPLITQFVDQFDCTFHRSVAETFYGTYADSGGVVDADEAFLGALFQAMFLMWFFNTEGRWQRILWATDHEQELCDAIDSAIH